MTNFKQYIYNHHSTIAFWVCTIVTIVLLIGGALTPPPFIIDSSILTACGILAGFAVIGLIPDVIREIKDGRSVTFKHKDTEIELTSKN